MDRDFVSKIKRGWNKKPTNASLSANDYNAAWSNKEKKRNRYYKRVHLALKSELYLQNRNLAINSFAVSVVQGSFSLLNGTLAEIKWMNVKIRNLLICHCMLYSDADVSTFEECRALVQLHLIYKVTTIAIQRYPETTEV